MRDGTSSENALQGISPETLVSQVIDIFHRDILVKNGECYDYDHIKWLSAAMSSSEYALRSMRHARRFLDWNEQFRYIYGLIPEDLKASGLHLEFGVCSGRTINAMARQAPSATFYGFDSFEGLPDEWFPGTQKGIFATENVPEVAPNVQLIVGYFDATLPSFMTKNRDAPVAFIHMDCDIYSSTVTALNALRDAIRPGTIILFDEYLNYPEWQLHEYKAWKEFCESWRVKYTYVSAMPSHMKVAVQVVARG